MWTFLFIWMAGWLCIPHLLLLNKRPTATLAWLWAILLFPIFGAGLYLAIGTERVKRRRMKLRREFRTKKRLASGRADTAETAAHLADETSLAPEAKTLFEGLAAITHLPLGTASNLRVLHKAPAFYTALRESIQQAKRDIHIESYIWRDDEVGREFFGLLVDAAQRGVTVRLLLDEFGCWGLRESTFRPLIEAGGKFSWCHTFSPLRNRYFFNLRNHRKLQVIDGITAFVGGMNFGREYLGCDKALGDWSDVQIRVEGTIVEIFQQVFIEDWFFATGQEDPLKSPASVMGEDQKIFAQVLTGGPDENNHPMLRINLALMGAARKRLWISTGYFVPGETIQTVLQVASAHGVDVRLLVSEKSEHPYLVKAGRSYYEALMQEGVRIFEYRRGIEHSKYMIIDDDWTMIGSCNLDERSMRLNFELGLLALHRETNENLADIFSETIERSQEINLDEFSRRPFSEKLLESALRPLSPLL
jgi:cardiolipin synthase